MHYKDALRIAEYYVDLFRPVCKRIEIKGSVLRRKSEPGDIEILAVPDLTPPSARKIEFGKPVPKIRKTRVDELVDELIAADVCYLKAGKDKYKKLWLIKEHIQLDLFLVTPPAEWGVLSVIRTGPSDFSHWMVTRKSIGGALPDEYIVADGAVGKRERPLGFSNDLRAGVIPMPEEIDFFRLCGLDWIEPVERVARWKK